MHGNKLILISALTGIILFLTHCDKERSTDYPIQPVPFTKVHMTDAFWAPKMEINRTITIPVAFSKCEETGRINNFALAGGIVKTGEHMGDYPFDDTDVFKVIEGASYVLAESWDPELDRYLDSLIMLIAAAQEDDGYLYTCRTNNCTRLRRWMGDERWERLNSHELYNLGHLIEAAVAHYQATGKSSLLDVAVKAADLVDRDFGPAPDQKHCPSGHPIIEMALVKLYRVTGERRYLELAKFFIDETGYAHDGHNLNEYSQDHKPVIEQDEAVGHAVRFGYLYSGITDVAAIMDHEAYKQTLLRVWDNVVSKKLYITGGIGARAWGEGFGLNYELPNMTAYCETCAAIANVFWNQRMFLLFGESKYIDVLEKTLYNGVLSGVSQSGDRFFYENLLESNGAIERQEWFGCACCPGNITRFISSVPGYVYAIRDNNLYINLFAGNQAQINLDDRKVEIQQETGYPWNGNVLIRINPEESFSFSVWLRIPGWAVNEAVPSDLYRFADMIQEPPAFKVNGENQQVRQVNGYAVIRRKWKKGDQIEMIIPMPVQKVIANTSVEDDVGKIALQRGPIIYCLEGKDQEGGTALNVWMDQTVTPEVYFDSSLLGGVQVIKAGAHRLFLTGDGVIDEDTFICMAIPYYTWNNRGNDEMVTWIPKDIGHARIKPPPSIASRASSTSSLHWAAGLNDQFEPVSSADKSKPFFDWWLRKGTEEWVEYQFDKPEKISGTSVYWLCFDHYDIHYRLPEWWKVLYKDGKEWKPVKNKTPIISGQDKYNTVEFEPVLTNGLRVEVKLQEDMSAGILEWKVF